MMQRKTGRSRLADLKFFSGVTTTNCYWAGFIAADGCLYPKYKQLSFDLKITDFTQLLKFCKAADCKEKVKAVYRKDKDVWAAQLYIRGVEDWIRDLDLYFNITPRKSLTLKPPSLLIEQEHRLAYIRGLVDGDGCIGKYFMPKQDRWDWVIHLRGTDAILSYVKDTFDKLVPTEGKKRVANVTTKPPIQYVVRGLRAEKIISLLSSINTPYLERKWNKFMEEKYEEI
jgi:hypothetical protein